MSNPTWRRRPWPGAIPPGKTDMPNTRPVAPSPLRRRVCAGLLWLASLAAAHTAAAGVPTFTRYPVCPDITDSPDIQAVDFNGDGHVDVLVGGLDHVVLCANNGTGTFTSSTLVAAPGGTNTKVVAADLNRDGLMDLVGIDRAGGAVVWWRNDGGGAFTKVIVAGGVSGLSDVYVSDLDGNGWPDILVAADSSNQVLWWRNNGTLAAVPERLFVSDRDSSNYRLAVIDTTSRSQAATSQARQGLGYQRKGM